MAILYIEENHKNNEKNEVNFSSIEEYMEVTRQRAALIMQEQSVMLENKAKIIKDDLIVNKSYVEFFDGFFEVEIQLLEDGYANIITGGFFYSEKNKTTRSIRVKIHDLDLAVNKLSVYFQELHTHNISSKYLNLVLENIQDLLNPQKIVGIYQ